MSNNYAWYSRVDTSSAGRCGVVSSYGSQQQCGAPTGATGMCYSHEAALRAEISRNTGSNYATGTYATGYYQQGYGYSQNYGSYGSYGR